MQEYIMELIDEILRGEVNEVYCGVVELISFVVLVDRVVDVYDRLVNVLIVLGGFLISEAIVVLILGLKYGAGAEYMY
jgi:hypothetical protein